METRKAGEFVRIPHQHPQLFQEGERRNAISNCGEDRQILYFCQKYEIYC